MRLPLARPLPRVLALALTLAGAAFGVASCGTLPESAGGQVGLPAAGGGPFLALADGQIGNSHVAPNGLVDIRSYSREASVIRTGTGDSLKVAAYLAAAGQVDGMSPKKDTPSSAITRFEALDGRTFPFDGEVILTADQDWEGGSMQAPSIVKTEGGYLLFYAAAGGIGLATGTDGKTFEKVDGPVLGPDASGWEAGAVPRSPGAVVIEGALHLFYEVAVSTDGSAIGEARSTDGGKTWTRLGKGPVLAPTGGPMNISGAGGAGADGGAPDVPIDGVSVEGPFAMTDQSADGRLIVRLYYGAVDALGNRVIGLAARYGSEGDFERATVSVFGGNTHVTAPREPCVVDFGKLAMIYATQPAGTFDSSPVTAIGITPADAAMTLGAPDPK